MFFKLLPGFGTGLAIGLGAGIITKTVGRPTIKAAVKTGLLLFDKTREQFAHAGEAFEDLVAEAKAELDSTPGAATGSGQRMGAEATGEEAIARNEEEAGRKEGGGRKQKAHA